MNDDKEFSIGWTGSSSGKRGNFSRKLKLTSRKITVIHKSTGLKLVDEILPGHYSKKEMKRLTEQKFKEMKDKLKKIIKIGGEDNGV